MKKAAMKVETICLFSVL